jgi:hypothetical protein
MSSIPEHLKTLEATAVGVLLLVTALGLALRYLK